MQCILQFVNSSEYNNRWRVGCTFVVLIFFVRSDWRPRVFSLETNPFVFYITSEAVGYFVFGPTETIFLRQKKSHARSKLFVGRLYAEYARVLSPTISIAFVKHRFENARQYSERKSSEIKSDPSLPYNNRNKITILFCSYRNGQHENVSVFYSNAFDLKQFVYKTTGMLHFPGHVVMRYFTPRCGDTDIVIVNLISNTSHRRRFLNDVTNRVTKNRVSRIRLSSIGLTSCANPRPARG